MKNIFIRLYAGIASIYYRNRYKNISLRDETRDIFANEVRQKISWPENYQAVCNLQFDDFCAKSKENDTYDFGGAVGKGINTLFDEFLNKHAFVKTTLFVIPKPSFKNYKGIFYGDTGDIFNLSMPEYKKLIDWAKQKKDRVEIACHGYTHMQNKTKFFLNFAEFEFSNEEESEQYLKKSLQIFERIGIKPKGFRPPGFAVGENNKFKFIGALKKTSFDYVSLSSPFSGLNWSKKRVSNLYPEFYESMLNLPQNISIAWNIGQIKKTIDRIVEMNGVITLMGHYNEENDWMEDGIGKNNLKKLKEIFEYMEKKYSKQIWYATLGEIADFWNNKYYENRN